MKTHHRLNLDLDKVDYSNLQKLKEIMRAASMAEVIRALIRDKVVNLQRSH